MAPARQSPSELLAQLQGKQVLRVPNLWSLFLGWRSGSTNPHLEDLTQVTNNKIDSWTQDTSVRRKLKAIDVPLFCCAWWPNAKMGRLVTMSTYLLWLFVWDDDLDGTPEAVTQTPTEIEKLHHCGLEYVAYHLGLDEDDTMAAPSPPKQATAIFAEIGQSLRVACPLVQRQRFFQELRHYMQCCAVEHDYLSRGVLPTADEYWGYRFGTSSMYPVLALTEYMLDVEMPDVVLQALELRTMWLEVNRNIVLVNDLISLKKEMKSSLHSYVPIMMNDKACTLPVAVANIVEELRQSVDMFNRASHALLLVNGDLKTIEAVISYVDVLQSIMTGSYTWSLATRRYDVTGCLQDDGSLVIHL